MASGLRSVTKNRPGKFSALRDDDADEDSRRIQEALSYVSMMHQGGPFAQTFSAIGESASATTQRWLADPLRASFAVYEVASMTGSVLGVFKDVPADVCTRVSGAMSSPGQHERRLQECVSLE